MTNDIFLTTILNGVVLVQRRALSSTKYADGISAAIAWENVSKTHLIMRDCVSGSLWTANAGEVRQGIKDVLAFDVAVAQFPVEPEGSGVINSAGELQDALNWASDNNARGEAEQVALAALLSFARAAFPIELGKWSGGRATALLEAMLTWFQLYRDASQITPYKMISMKDLEKAREINQRAELEGLTTENASRDLITLSLFLANGANEESSVYDAVDNTLTQMIRELCPWRSADCERASISQLRNIIHEEFDRASSLAVELKAANEEAIYRYSNMKRTYDRIRSMLVKARAECVYAKRMLTEVHLATYEWGSLTHSQKNHYAELGSALFTKWVDSLRDMLDGPIDDPAEPDPSDLPF